MKEFYILSKNDIIIPRDYSRKQSIFVSVNFEKFVLIAYFKL